MYKAGKDAVDAAVTQSQCTDSIKGRDSLLLAREEDRLDVPYKPFFPDFFPEFDLLLTRPSIKRQGSGTGGETLGLGERGDRVLGRRRVRISRYGTVL